MAVRKSPSSSAVKSEPKKQVQADCFDSVACPAAAPAKKTAAAKKSSATKILIRYDAGFPNQLFIRGKGANLSWDRGFPLKNISANEWVWESDAAFSALEFKVLINDAQYEVGDNHQITCGSTIQYTPKF